MKLYEINEEILALVAQLDCDPETGEVSIGTDEIIEQLNTLEMERSSVLEYLAKLVLDIRAGVTALKAEETRLRERRSALEGKDNRLMQIIDRECAGQKTELGIATVCYRRTTKVEVLDSESAVVWLKEHGHPECYRTPAPEVSKSNVGKLLTSGKTVPGIELVSGLSCSLK